MMLPWPGSSTASNARPRRVSGSIIILVEGHPVFFVEKGGKKLISFPKAEEPEFLEAGLRGLDQQARNQRGKMLQVLEIDARPAQKSPLYPAFKAFGFRDDYQGLTYLASPQVS
jgi:ATP-dependent Lhr-like helicase